MVGIVQLGNWQSPNKLLVNQIVKILTTVRNKTYRTCLKIQLIFYYFWNQLVKYVILCL